MEDIPSYGSLIDIFLKAKETDCTSDSLLLQFKEHYPHVYIGRPDRFMRTVERIVAPTLPSILGKEKLSGDALEEYRKKSWYPRIRNPPKGMDLLNLSFLYQ